jgi:glycosyltransferase involved in cell wall biosynthesis
MSKIKVLTVSGSPKNVTPDTLNGRGVGGAELALITWSELLAKSGNEVTVYNQTGDVNYYRENTDTGLGFTKFTGDASPTFEQDDILVTFRGPNEIARTTAHKKHLGWSCDQFTVGDYIDWYNSVDKMILISEFHKRDHIMRYGKELVESKAQVLDLGVRTWEYEQQVEKVPYQFIYCSIPDRGLEKLHQLWPQIKSAYPAATLIITSDYTLWGAADPLNMQYRLMFAGLDGVKFVGNVPRTELVRYQMQSEIQIYPCIYDENFCIANAECQVAGCFTVTSAQGALETTNFTGYKVRDGDYLTPINEFYRLDENTRKELTAAIRHRAFSRFGWQKIASDWERIFND